MAVTTIFSWGYWGWGNATKELKQGVDAAERARNQKPPFFVDIRLRRSGRAKGFVRHAFEEVIGSSRYRWMNSLGNLKIASGEAGVEIKEPETAQDLLEFALEKHRESQRLLFFCACEFPWRDGELACHRDTVTRLLLKKARAIGKTVEVIEWPGREPEQIRIEVSGEIVKAVRRGRKSVPLPGRIDLGVYAGLPWGSVITLVAGEESANAIVGPARYVWSSPGGQWVLPILQGSEPGLPVERLQRLAGKFRLEHGLEPRFLRA